MFAEAFSRGAYSNWADGRLSRSFWRLELGSGGVHLTWNALCRLVRGDRGLNYVANISGYSALRKGYQFEASQPSSCTRHSTESMYSSKEVGRTRRRHMWRGDVACFPLHVPRVPPCHCRPTRCTPLQSGFGAAGPAPPGRVSLRRSPELSNQHMQSTSISRLYSTQGLYRFYFQISDVGSTVPRPRRRCERKLALFYG